MKRHSDLVARISWFLIRFGTKCDHPNTLHEAQLQETPLVVFSTVLTSLLGTLWSEEQIWSRGNNKISQLECRRKQARQSKSKVVEYDFIQGYRRTTFGWAPIHYGKTSFSPPSTPIPRIHHSFMGLGLHRRLDYGQRVCAPSKDFLHQHVPPIHFTVFRGSAISQ